MNNSLDRRLDTTESRLSEWAAVQCSVSVLKHERKE